MSLDRMQRLLGSLLGQSEFELIRFENQPSKGGAGVPDAIIQSSVRLLIETKTVRGTVGIEQIVRHLERLNNASETTALLLVLTPDDISPKVLDELDDSRVVWASFVMVDQAIDEILDDKSEVVSEREAFLMRELQSMLAAEGLLANANDVAIVAARSAWPEYNELHAYICQPNRPFQQVSRMGFYSQGVIYPLVPKIIEAFDEIEIRRNKHQGELGDLVNRLVENELRPLGERFKVLILSAPEAPETLKLPCAIPNDKLSKSGEPIAFTMGQRYVASEALLRAKTTTDLD
ncbi:hypothetical protein [Symmachiella dynata]|uniref:hypothetical protein n=1 Tax=Symmachiella dynata TaxID=2527995 RepID=UPI0030EEFE82